MALVLLFEDLLLRSVEPFELPGDEFVRAVTSASKTVKEKKRNNNSKLLFPIYIFLFSFLRIFDGIFDVIIDDPYLT